MPFGAHETMETHEILMEKINCITHFNLYAQQARHPQLRDMIRRHQEEVIRSYNELVAYTHDYNTFRPIPSNTDIHGVTPQQVQYGLRNPQPIGPEANAALDDREIAIALLLCHKNGARNSTWASLECADPNLRRMMLNSAAACVNQAYEVFLFMNQQGLYQVPTLNDHTAKTFMHSYQPADNAMMQQFGRSSSMPGAGQSMQPAYGGMGQGSQFSLGSMVQGMQGGQSGMYGQQGGQPGLYNQQGNQSGMYGHQGSQSGLYNQQGSQSGMYGQQGSQSEVYSQQGGQSGIPGLEGTAGSSWQQNQAGQPRGSTGVFDGSSMTSQTGNNQMESSAIAGSPARGSQSRSQSRAGQSRGSQSLNVQAGGSETDGTLQTNSKDSVLYGSSGGDSVQ